MNRRNLHIISAVLAAAASAFLLTGCGVAAGKALSSPGTQTSSGSGKADAESVSGQDLLEDTHQTEYSTQSGTEPDTERDNDLVVELTEGADGETAREETSRIQQESESLTEDHPAGTKPVETSGEGESSAESSGESGSAKEKQTEEETGPFGQVIDVIKGRESSGESWALAYQDLSAGEKYGYHEEERMQSASVIKLFIMGAVYRYMCYPEKTDPEINFGESYDGELRDTITKMITVSDNDAANRLVESLGQGDFTEGEKLVDRFCQENGYRSTSLGRRFMASDLSEGDNFTSAEDVRKFYSDLCHGTLVNDEASGKMLDILKGQTLKSKIPAGLPEGFSSVNKTGEMPDGYGLGSIENDSAVVFPPDGSGKKGYILVVLSGNLSGKNDEAQELITQISSQTAQWYLSQG